MEKFIEFQNWGFNVLIISSFMTMAFSVFQGYGFVLQAIKIFREKSVRSLSLPVFFLFFSYFMAFVIYGIDQNSIAITFNGLLFIFVAPIIIGIFKFKEIKVKDVFIFIVIMAIVPIMIFVKDKDSFLFFLLVVNLVVLSSQILTIMKEKSMGAVEIKLIIILLATSCFWLIYSIWIINLPLILFNSAVIILYLNIIILHRKYRMIKI